MSNSTKRVKELQQKNRKHFIMDINNKMNRVGVKDEGIIEIKGCLTDFVQV